MNPQQNQNMPSPMLFMDTAFAFQRTAVLKAGVQLKVFTAIGEGKETAQQIADRCGASARGIRILCDNLVISGFLTKEADRYQLTPDSAMFLDQKSPAYLGGALEFLLNPELVQSFDDFAAAVRKGGSVLPGQGSIEPENPLWVEFARAMAPLMAFPAQLLVNLADPDSRASKLLDIAAGHGMFGIAFARSNPKIEITAVDWRNVLEVAKENAKAAEVANRYRTLPGSAFDVEYGTGYDIVLITNFMHHFDVPTNENFLRKVHAALNPGGRAVIFEFVPDENRVTPPMSARFSAVMLAMTPAGDAYTFSEYQRMLEKTGFAKSEIRPLPPAVQQVIIAQK